MRLDARVFLLVAAAALLAGAVFDYAQHGNGAVIYLSLATWCLAFGLIVWAWGRG